MIFYTKIYNKSYIFQDSSSLLKFSEINKIDKQNYSSLIKINEEDNLNLIEDYIYNNNTENSSEKSLIRDEFLPDYSLISQKIEQGSKRSIFSSIYNYLNIIPKIKIIQLY